MGFCSKECFENAKKDLLIKDIAGDEFDYQGIRDQIKNDPSLYAELQKKIADHLDEGIGNVVFNHATSQKETVIFQD